ncbi:MAG: baseplate J/gp47 family protein [Bacteroidetes bacterium]|nr:baseplate J/gp47 family protein [Bacteroidota bacterium]
MSCADQKNPLQHSGTSQQQRKAPALLPAFVRVDEHDFPDWIVFASRFSEYLNYYSDANIPTNNWQPFFNNDIAAVLGSISIQDIETYREQIKERFDFLRDDDHELEQSKLEATLGSLFSALLTLSIALDRYLFRLPKDHVLRLRIQNIITQKLQPALSKLLAYYKGGRNRHRKDGTEDPTLVIIANKDFPDWSILGLPVKDVLECVKSQNLSAIWLAGKPNLKSFFNSRPIDSSIYGEETESPFRRIQHAANHNLFISLFDDFLGNYARLIQEAEAALNEVLTRFNAHPAHYALFLSFLHLFRKAQDQLNTFSGRHLNFYYQRVLRLEPRAARPNQVHILAGLAKGFNSYSLPKDTRFRAGKDSLGKELAYVLEEETVFNQAKVAHLMSVYRGAAVGINGAAPIDNIGSVNNQGRLFASPVANSADGLGAKITGSEIGWHPFVQKTFVDGALQNILAPKAEIGFAIASAYLALAEGDRYIELSIQLAGLPAPLPSTLSFNASLTSPKKWLELSVTAITDSAVSGGSDAIIIRISLDGNMPPISNWNPKIHGASIGADLPTLKLLLRNEDDAAYQYDALKACTIQSLSLKVSAGIDPLTSQASKTGLRQLLLSNELGIIDPAKPFQPFGLSPRVGSACTLGCEEFFKKSGASFQLKLKWLDLPESLSSFDYDGDDPEGDITPNVSLQALAKGEWINIRTNQNLWEQNTAVKNRKKQKGGKVIPTKATLKSDSGFPSNFQTLSFGSGSDTSAYSPYDAPYLPYSVRSSSGFMRIVLESGFGYEDYQKAYAAYLAKLAFGSGKDPGAAPYVPRLESISLHYSAQVTEGVGSGSETDFESRSVRFHHLTPFGQAEQHHFLTPDSNISLLPLLAQDQAGQDSGALFIGLENLDALQSVNLLFGVVEGSSDPLVAKPEQQLHWSYLSRNSWKDFPAQSIRDASLQWIQSGIISFPIPEDATNDNTLLPSGFIWLRASAASATMALCKLVSIDAQAALVSFLNQDNDAGFLNAQLPAGTITKLQTSVPAIKKIAQPYPSFGGRPTELESDYYVRISERLRHKDRAITIWDYERLILEHFPELHRVKCLSHTAYELLGDGSVRYNEMAPGHVTVITIPRLEGLQLTNPLRPYTSERVLAQIDAFLRQRITCQMQLNVVHPLFEEVALDFQLRLLSGFDDYTFYSQKLKEEITAFLTPWAYDVSAELFFGGTVRKSVLINFIEERPYVDYISQVKMYHRTASAPNSVVDTDEITASTGMAILVSVPASKHKITAIPAPATKAAQVVCTDPAAATKA